MEYQNQNNQFMQYTVLYGDSMNKMEEFCVIFVQFAHEKHDLCSIRNHNKMYNSICNVVINIHCLSQFVNILINSN